MFVNRPCVTLPSGGGGGRSVVPPFSKVFWARQKTSTCFLISTGIWSVSDYEALCVSLPLIGQCRSLLYVTFSAIGNAITLAAADPAASRKRSEPTC